MKVVIPSVGYADMLAITLPAWIGALPKSATVRVVTAPEDAETVTVAGDLDAEVVITEAWRQDGAAFNKAAALDIAFGFAGEASAPRVGEVCLALDADVYPAGLLPTTSTTGLQRDVLYGCARHLCLDAAALAKFTAGRLTLDDLPRRNSAERGAGYFQLFRYRAGLTFGSFPTAGYYDLAFHQQFARVAPLDGFAVLHLGRTSSKNWHGRRVTPRWRTR